MDNSTSASDRPKRLIGIAAALLAGAGVFAVVAVQPKWELASSRGSATADDDDLFLLEQASQQPNPSRVEGIDDSDDGWVAAESDKTSQDNRSAQHNTELQDAPAFQYVRGNGTKDPSSRVTPAPYRERLALLEQEREALLRRSQRDQASGEGQAAITQTVAASMEADAADVVPAVAETSDPASLRRVRLVRHHPLAMNQEPPQGPRGAWLSGIIEVE
jgi:hypothetical protein